jgi:hypothetical protein
VNRNVLLNNDAVMKTNTDGNVDGSYEIKVMALGSQNTGEAGMKLGYIIGN